MTSVESIKAVTRASLKLLLHFDCESSSSGKILDGSSFYNDRFYGDVSFYSGKILDDCSFY